MGPEERTRFRIALLALAALPLLLLLDTGVALLRGWTSISNDPKAMTVFAGGLLALLGMASLLSPVRRFLARQWAQMVFVVCTTAVFWLVAEALLAFTQPDIIHFHRHLPHETHLFTPNPEWVPGVHGNSRYTANSLGVRGPEWPPRNDAYRILVVGGSTTENLYLDDQETWTRLLMERLNAGSGDGEVWVGDVGRSGHASWQHLRFLDESTLVEQVDCILVLMGINDFLRANRGQPVEINTRARPLWRRSIIYNGARNMLVGYTKRDTTERETPDGSNYEVRRKERQAAPPSDELPDLSDGLAQYKRNIRKMIEAAEDRGVRLVFLSQPVIWDAGLSPRGADLLWFGRTPDDRFLTPARLRDGMEQFNAALLEVCAEQNAECVDLSSMHGREDYYFDDAHFTEAGAVEVARLVSEYLGSRPRSRP